MRAGVIGLGYVGLPLAHGLVSAGVDVVGFDVDPTKVEMLQAGRSYLDHLDANLFQDLEGSAHFEATTDVGRLSKCDAVIVCVPTPLGRHQEPDLSYVISAAQDIGRVLRPGQRVLLESTTYPGTTRDDFLPAMLEACASESPPEVGVDIFVACSPEREDPGRKERGTSIPKLVGGIDEPSQRLAHDLYSVSHDDVVSVPRAEVAEAVKLLENIFRSVNIALVNEMKHPLTVLRCGIATMKLRTAITTTEATAASLGWADLCRLSHLRLAVRGGYCP